MLKAKYNKQKSWEKQQYFTTDEGIMFGLSYSIHYGEWVHSIEDKEGRWQACDGTQTMPERFKQFLEWEEVVVKSCNTKLIRPLFEKVW